MERILDVFDDKCLEFCTYYGLDVSDYCRFYEFIMGYDEKIVNYLNFPYDHYNSLSPYYMTLVLTSVELAKGRKVTVVSDTRYHVMIRTYFNYNQKLLILSDKDIRDDFSMNKLIKNDITIVMSKFSPDIIGRLFRTHMNKRHTLINLFPVSSHKPYSINNVKVWDVLFD